MKLKFPFYKQLDLMDNHRKSYIYEKDYELSIGFVDKSKIIGGNNKINGNNFWECKNFALS